MFVNMLNTEQRKLWNKEKAYIGALPPPPERAFKSLVVNSLKGAYWREKEEGGRRSGGGREKGERRERERGIRLYTIHYRVNT